MTARGGMPPLHDAGWCPVSLLDPLLSERWAFEDLCSDMGCAACTASVYDTPYATGFDDPDAPAPEAPPPGWPVYDEEIPF